MCSVLSYPALKDWIKSVVYSYELFLAHNCGYARSLLLASVGYVPLQIPYGVMVSENIPNELVGCYGRYHEIPYSSILRATVHFRQLK